MSGTEVKENRAGLYPHYGMLAAFLIIIAVCLLIYSSAIGFPFQFDDISYIVENSIIKDLSNFWPPFGTRYLTHLSFALNYRFAGLNPGAFRLTNIVIHAFNACLVFLLVHLTFKTPWMEAARVKDRRKAAFYTALFASLLFAAHPVQTQAVTYVTQRFASLATTFYLLSILFYIKSRLDDTRCKKAFYIFSILCAIAAQKTKEISFTLPFMIVLYEFAFFSGPKGARNRVLRLIPFMAALLIIPATLYLESGLTEGIAAQIKRMQIEEMTNLSRRDYLISQFMVIATYLRLMALPVNQRLVYDYDLLHSINDARVILPFLFLASLFAFSLYLFIRSRRKKDGLGVVISAGVIWFFITVSVESSVIPIKDIIFEHRVYLPGAGMATASGAFFVYAAGRLKDRWGRPPLAWACIALMALTIAPLAYAAYMRNQVWRDDTVLWLDTVGKSPKSPRAQYNLARSYHLKNDFARAATHYKEAIRFDPGKEEAHYNLAVLYQSIGDNPGAIDQFKESIRLKPKAATYYNLGIAYQTSGDVASAIEAYKGALRTDPGHVDARYNLAYAYQEAGDYANAVALYREVIRLAPRSADAHFNLGVINAKKGMRDEASAEFAAALRIKPDYSEAAGWLNRLSHPEKGGARR